MDTLYIANGCVRCGPVKRQLENKYGLTLNVLNVSEDADAEKRAQASGLSGLPLLETSQGVWLSGPADILAWAKDNS